MIYHSVIPYEHILFQQAAPQDKQQSPARIMTVHSGVTMEVSVLGDGHRRIERLYSTDPRSYLDQQFRIGTIL
jgi:hypothetical protein